MLWSLGVVGVARAGDEAPEIEEAPPVEPTEAVRLFEEGKRLFADGEIAQACETFAQSAELERTVGVLLNLARCHATMGRIATAHREYVEAGALAREQGQQERAEAAEALAADLAPRVPKVRVQVAGVAADEVVTFDGAPLRPADYGVARAVDPGTHEIRAEAPGRRAWTKTVEVVESGEELVVTVPALVSVDDEPIESTSSEGMGSVRLAGFIVGGVGVATAIVGGVLGGLTLSKVSDAESDPALCPGKVCTPAGREQIDGARGLGIAATVLLGLGGAAAAAGAVMVIVDDGSTVSTPTEAELGVWVVGPGAGLSAGLRF